MTAARGAAGERGAVLALGLALCVCGAGFVLLGLFDTPGRLAGLGAAMAGVVLTAPQARTPGPVDWWWQAAAVGLIIVLAGTALELAVASLGGLLVAVGCIATIVGAALGPVPRFSSGS